MYLVDALSVLLRRWYIVLAGVLVLGGGVAAVVTYVPTTWQSSGQMLLLLPPQGSGTDEPVNPYLNLQAGLTTAASLVTGAVTAKDIEKEMEDAGFESEYAVAVVPGTGPLISVTTKDSDPDMATATREAVMAWIDSELLRIQEEVNVPKTQYMSATRSSVSRTAEALPGSKLRALAALFAVVALLTLVLTFGLDRLLLRRAALPATEPKGKAANAESTSVREPESEPEVAVKVSVEDEKADGLLLQFHPKQTPAPQVRRQNKPRQSNKRKSGRSPRVGANR